MELLELMKYRRSIRNFTDEAIPEEKLTKIIQAGLLSASGKARRPWEFIVVQDKETLKEMVGCRVGGSHSIGESKAAIVVIADPEKSDVWVEDTSIAMTNMWLMAVDEGLSCCWVQARLRGASDKTTASEYLQKILGYPEGYEALAVLVIGVGETHPGAYELESLPMDKVHYEKF